MKKLLVICGPTATGKTQLAIQCAKMFDGEIVSADSRQVYKGMDIVTGKDVQKSKKNEHGLSVSADSSNFFLSNYIEQDIPLWLYDIVYPDQEFSVSHYVRYATSVIANIHERNKLPILVGGTGLYISAVVTGLDLMEIPRDSELRERLERLTVNELQNMLAKADPLVWNQLNNSDRNNPRRLVRKIEIAQSPSAAQKKDTQYNTHWIGLYLTKEKQLLRIEQRVKQRIEDGALYEVKKLVEKNYSWNLPSMQAIGYSEWKEYLEHPTKDTFSEAVHLWELHELQYAKRQLTWFKKNPSIQWYDASLPTIMDQIVQVSTSWYNNNV